MQRRYVISSVVVVVVAVTSFAIWYALAPAKPAANHGVYVPITTTSFSDATIIATCDGTSPNVSLGLSKPTLVSRLDGVDAVIFATKSTYSACIVFGNKNFEETHPTLFVPIKRGVKELESLSMLNKIVGRSRYATDSWFVVRVSPSVSTVKAVTQGRSQVSNIGDGFVLVHERESADIRGKFSYGVAAGFSAGGDLVGSTTLT
jgi:hypothetical protein